VNDVKARAQRLLLALSDMSRRWNDLQPAKATAQRPAADAVRLTMRLVQQRSAYTAWATVSRSTLAEVIDQSDVATLFDGSSDRVAQIEAELALWETRLVKLSADLGQAMPVRGVEIAPPPKPLAEQIEDVAKWIAVIAALWALQTFLRNRS